MNRRNLLKSIGSAGVIGGLAGCGEPQMPRKDTLWEHVERHWRVAQCLGTDENLNFRNGDDEWLLSIKTINPDGTISIKAEKNILDEEGADKEGIDDSVTIHRNDITLGESVMLSHYIKLWYFDAEGDEVCIAIGDEYNETCEESNGCLQITSTNTPT